MRALIAILEDKISQGELNSDFKISKSDLSYKINDPLDESIDLVVRSTAVRADDPDMLFMQKHNIRVIHRSEMLNLLSEDAKQIVISGTHGKTSTSALTTHLLTKLGLEPGFAVGGVLKDYKANGKAAPKSSSLNDGPSGYFVMEGDESDKSFMRTTPYIAVVTDVEADHLENYPGGLAEIQACFKDFLDRAEYKIVCINNPFLKAYAENILKERPDLKGKIFSYSSIDESADLNIELFHVDELQYNITKHFLVPKHELFYRKNTIGAFDFKKKYSSKFPFLLKNDPVARFYGFDTGDIIKIIRNEGIIFRIVK